MLRNSLFQILTRLKKSHKTCPKNGLYPPNINLCTKQTDEEVLKQLRVFLRYLEHPHHSYLKKN